MKHKLCERAVAEKLAALQHLNGEALKQRWRAPYQTEPPARISRSLLLQAVAYRPRQHSSGNRNLLLGIS